MWSFHFTFVRKLRCIRWDPKTKSVHIEPSKQIVTAVFTVKREIGC